MPRDEIARSLSLPPRIEPPAAPLGTLATWRAARRNLLEVIPRGAYHDAQVWGETPTRWRMVSDPDAIEQLLKVREPDYPKSDAALRLLRPAQGDSLFTAHGAEWRWQRRAVTPVFQPRNLATLSPVMTAAAEAASARLAGAAGGVAEVHTEMVAATFDIICDTALSGRERLDRRRVSAGVTAFIETVGRVSLLDVLGVPDWVPRPNRLSRTESRRMDRMVDTVIAARRRRGPVPVPDLLDLMLGAQDPETGRRHTPAEVRNNLIAFLIAGHETTALALSWSLFLCAFDPAVQVRAAEQAQAVLGDRAATAADCARLPYVRQVLDEAMRLYPPAGLLSRGARRADVMLGRAVAPKETVMVPVWAVHRHRALWDDPDAFDPDRFAPERSKGRHRYAYLPFGAGPRVCIGMGFALMEATIILATLLARLRFETVPGYAPTPRMLVTVRPEPGIVLRVSRR
jgi:cytochrome P450